MARTHAQARLRRINRLLKKRGQQNVCFYCGAHCVPYGNDPMTVEHVLARSRGGSNDLENLRIAHRSCNMAVASLPILVKLKLAGTMQRGVLPDWAKAQYEEPTWLRRIIAQAHRDPSWARAMASDDDRLEAWIAQAEQRGTPEGRAAAEEREHG